MADLQLVEPSLKYEAEIMKYRREFLDSGESMAGCGNLRECTTAKQWIDGIEILKEKETCPEDKVPSNTYMAIRKKDERLLGIIDFRHHIDHPILKVWGGHIGYSIRPSERRKGYAIEMLKECLTYCRKKGLEKVLITCDYDNLASKKTIVANGGIFEKEIVVEGERMERYWIDFSKSSRDNR